MHRAKMAKNIGSSTNYSQPASCIFRVFSYTYDCGKFPPGRPRRGY